MGFEPTTPALRKRCSAVELLRRPGGRRGGTTPGPERDIIWYGMRDFKFPAFMAPAAGRRSRRLSLQALEVQAVRDGARQVVDGLGPVGPAGAAAETAGAVADRGPQLVLAAGAPHGDAE